MTDQPLIDRNSVKKVVNVEAAQEIAWRVFTESMGTWCRWHTTKSEKPMRWMQ